MPRHLETRKVLDAVSALDSAGVIPPDIGTRAQNMRFYAVFGAGTSAGAVSVEGSHDPTYAGGTWFSLGVLTWTGAAGNVQSLAIVGNHVAVRMRVSTAIVGGTVDGWATTNGA